MATLASPFETDAPRIRFSRHNSRFVAKSAQRFRGTLTYDVKGDLVTRPASLQSPALSLVWDFDSKLRGADTNGTPATLEVTYEYDALGRRVARSGPGGNVVYIQAGQQTIADYPRGGVPASAMYRYVYGSYIDEPLLRETVSGSVRHFFHRNQQYSVTALTDSAGNTAERYAYTAYGGLTVFNSSGTPQATSPLNNRYTYTGREWDQSVAQHYFRARWFDSFIGRFSARDQLGYVDGNGMYFSYFGLAHLDPSGFACIKCECYNSWRSFETSWIESSCNVLAENCCRRTCGAVGTYRPTGRFLICGSREESEFFEGGGGGIVRHWINSIVNEAFEKARHVNSFQVERKTSRKLLGWEFGLKFGVRMSITSNNCVKLSGYGNFFGETKWSGPFPMTQWVLESSFGGAGNLSCCKCDDSRPLDILKDCTGDITANFGVKGGLKVGWDYTEWAQLYAEGGGYIGGEYSYRANTFAVKGYVYGRLVASIKSYEDSSRSWSQRFDWRWGSDVDF